MTRCERQAHSSSRYSLYWTGFRFLCNHVFIYVCAMREWSTTTVAAIYFFILPVWLNKICFNNCISGICLTVSGTHTRMLILSILLLLCLTSNPIVICDRIQQFHGTWTIYCIMIDCRFVLEYSHIVLFSKVGAFSRVTVIEPYILCRMRAPLCHIAKSISCH